MTLRGKYRARRMRDLGCRRGADAPGQAATAEASRRAATSITVHKVLVTTGIILRLHGPLLSVDVLIKRGPVPWIREPAHEWCGRFCQVLGQDPSTASRVSAYKRAPAIFGWKDCAEVPKVKNGQSTWGLSLVVRSVTMP